MFKDEGWLAAGVREKYESVQDVVALEQMVADDVRAMRITAEVMALAAAIRGR